MKVRFTLLLTMALAAVPVTAHAQEERGELWEVQVVKVTPGHMDEFMATVGQVKAAAEAANLSSEFGWHTWTQDFEVAFASATPNMASFDDPEAWMRAFQGTAGEAMMQEAMGKFMTEISSTTSSREIWEHVEAWSYEPATPAFEKVIGKIIAFSEANGAYYPVNGYRTLFGDAGRVSFFVFADNWGDFFGKNSMEGQIAGTPAGEEWEGIIAELSDCISAYESSQMQYYPELSYTGHSM